MRDIEGTLIKESDIRIGRVIRSTRRHVDILDDKFDTHRGKIGARDLDVTVGDLVKYTTADLECVVHDYVPRKNKISRSYRGKTKVLATNLDLICLVVAPGRLLNTGFIDRVTATAFEQGVPSLLILNKIDRTDELDQVLPIIEIYKELGVKVVHISAKYGTGMDELRKELAHTDLKVTAFGGNSGVGKSTILNVLVPGARARTETVSRKTGQGRQTTSFALGHVYPRPGALPIVIVDLPGIQHFGISHLDKSDVVRGFPEILKLGTGCEFSDCAHIKEDNCEVRRALARGDLPLSRYRSYVAMVGEIESNKPY